MSVSRALLVVLWTCSAWTLWAQDQARFTSTRHVVSVPVSVKARNVPVTDLRLEEFQLLDNGVAQSLDSVTFDTVPIDLTLFIDNSGSTSGLHDRLREDLDVLMALLTSEDRIRVLTFNWGVRDVTGWIAPAPGLKIDVVAVSRASPVYDAMHAGLIHRADPGRRHLFIALTDGIDFGGIVGSLQLVEVARRSDAVVHLVMFSQSADPAANRSPFAILNTGPDADGQSRLRQIARDSGGVTYGTQGNTRERFAQILDDFRRSYVLHYSPVGVTRTGWHDLAVKILRAGNATVRARRGYFAG